MDIKADIISIKADSQIPDQLFDFEQIITGAHNRVKQVLKEKQVDLALGIENGLINLESVISYFGIACVFILNKNGLEVFSFSSAYFVP